MKTIGPELAQEILEARKEVRYVALRRDGQLSLREREGLHGASSSESDKYEELIVNPTLLTLVTQRGDIDCGGAQFVLIRYGNFFQYVAPIAGGHISIGMQPDCEPLKVIESLKPVLHRYGAALSASAR